MLMDAVVRDLELLVDDPFHFGVDLLRRALAIILAPDHLASEKNIFIVVAILDHAEFVAHAPVTNHRPRQRSRLLDVAGGARGDVAGDNFLGDAAGHGNRDHVEHFFAAPVQHIVFGQRHG